MLGKPKLKITEDYNGFWSVYIGYGNKRYINFKFKDDIFRGSSENLLLVEGEMTEAHPCQFCVLEGTMKMKAKAKRHKGGTVVIEFSTTFNDPKSFLEFP